jgi:hypothetical protein
MFLRACTFDGAGNVTTTQTAVGERDDQLLGLGRPGTTTVTLSRSGNDTGPGCSPPTAACDTAVAHNADVPRFTGPRSEAASRPR